LIENTFDRKRIYANPSPYPNSNPNTNPNLNPNSKGQLFLRTDEMTTFFDQVYRYHEKRNYIICGSINIDILSSDHKPTVTKYFNDLYAEACCNIINIPTKINNIATCFCDVLS